MPGTGTERFAIYYAPAADTALWRFGSSVLGYDAATGEAVPHPNTEIDWAGVTVSPRRYGFHATLKAPCHLAEGVTVGDVIRLAAEVARAMAPVEIDGLQVRQLGRFVALVPRGDTPEQDAAQKAKLSALAQAIVAAFEPMRQPLSQSDQARFTQRDLTPRQRENLARFGYPHVREDYRFHMTLSDALPGGKAERFPLWDRLRAMYQALDTGPIPIDQLVVYVQPDRQSPFKITARFPLSGIAKADVT